MPRRRVEPVLAEFDRVVDSWSIVPELRCMVRSPASGLRCTAPYKHATDHERRRRSGALRETWPRVDGDDPAPLTPTYAELLVHLNDLIDLARAEGYGRIVGVLSRARDELQYGPAGRARRRRGTRPPLLR